MVTALSTDPVQRGRVEGWRNSVPRMENRFPTVSVSDHLTDARSRRIDGYPQKSRLAPTFSTGGVERLPRGINRTSRSKSLHYIELFGWDAYATSLARAKTRSCCSSSPDTGSRHSPAKSAYRNPRSLINARNSSTVKF